jgi:hypothetical protein
VAVPPDSPGVLQHDDDEYGDDDDDDDCDFTEEMIDGMLFEFMRE